MTFHEAISILLSLAGYNKIGDSEGGGEEKEEKEEEEEGKEVEEGKKR